MAAAAVCSSLLGPLHPSSSRCASPPGASGRPVLGCCGLNPSSGTQKVHARGAVAAHARPGGRRRAEPEVELDDEWERPAFGLDLLPLAGGRVLRSASQLADRFVDVAHELAPAGTSRQVVDTATKAGLLLVTLAFANSILSFLLNAGFVLLAGYLATKVFGIQLFSSGSQSPPSLGPQPGNAKREPKRGPAGRQGGGSKLGFNTGLGQAAGDLADVWFERKPEPPKRGGRARKQA